MKTFAPSPTRGRRFRLVALASLAAVVAAGCALLAPREESFASLLARAEAGDAEAQFKVGKRYQYGDQRSGVEQDYARAAGWLRKAAEQGHAGAQSDFGTMLADGNGVEKDEEEAVAWYRKSAEQGNPYGEINLAWAYQSGKGGMDKDSAAAFEWMKKAADHDLPIAWFAMGDLYAEGCGVAVDCAEALRWYRKAAESDDEQARVFAQNSIGVCYQNGRGVAKDETEAVAWFRKSAEAGNPVAMNNLAECLSFGIGVEKDLEEAQSWREKARAVPANDPWYGWNVREMLENDRKTKELLERDDLDLDEECWIGSALRSGTCAVFDPDEGLRRLREAAERGSEKAQHYLAFCYAEGKKGFEKNPEECLRYLRMLAGNGDAEWQMRLGGALLGGRNGVKKNPREAGYWLRKAVEAGDKEAVRFLDWLEWNEPKADAEARIDLYAEREGATPDAAAAAEADAAAKPGSLAARIRAELFAPHTAGPDRNAPVGPRVRGALDLLAEKLADGSALKIPTAGAWGVFYDLTVREGADDPVLRWGSVVGQKRWRWDGKAREQLAALEERLAASGGTPFQKMLAAQARALLDPSDDTAAAFRAAAAAWRATLDPALPAAQVDAFLAALGLAEDAPPDATALFEPTFATRVEAAMLGFGVPKRWRDLADWRKAFDAFVKRAEDGDAVAQYWLGRIHWTGEYGVEKDTAKAEKWIRRAAEGGDAWAQYELGFALENGSFGAPDAAAALDWYRKAAEGGVEQAREALRRAETAERKFHAEAAEGESHAESAEAAEEESHAESAESAEVGGGSGEAEPPPVDRRAEAAEETAEEAAP